MRVTADDVRELLTGGGMDPTLILWLDTRETEVWAGPTLTDISWCERGRPYVCVTTANDLASVGDYDYDDPTDEDCEALAEMLTDGLPEILAAAEQDD